AVAIYRLRRTVEKKLPPAHRRRKQLKDISTSAKRILKLLGVDKAESIASGVRIGSNLHPTAITDVLIALYRIGVQRRPETANISATERRRAWSQAPWAPPLSKYTPPIVPEALMVPTNVKLLPGTSMVVKTPWSSRKPCPLPASYAERHRHQSA